MWIKIPRLMAFSWSLFPHFAFQILSFSSEMDEELQKRNTDCVYFLASPLTCKKVREKAMRLFRLFLWNISCLHEVFDAPVYGFMLRNLFVFVFYDSYSMVYWIGPTFEMLICYVRVCWNEGWLRVLVSTSIKLVLIFMLFYLEIIWHLDFYVVFAILTILSLCFMHWTC